MLPNLKIGNLTAKYPIIQGGMGVGIRDRKSTRLNSSHPK